MALYPPAGGALDLRNFPNFGARRIEAAVRAAALDVEVAFVESWEASEGEMIARVVEAAPDVLAVSAYMWSLPRLLRIVAGVRARCPAVRVVLGGPQAHPNVLQLPAFRDQVDGVEAIVLEEPELTFVALLTALSTGRPMRSVPGLAVREDGRWVRTAPASESALISNALIIVSLFAASTARWIGRSGSATIA